MKNQAISRRSVLFSPASDSYSTSLQIPSFLVQQVATGGFDLPDSEASAESDLKAENKENRPTMNTDIQTNKEPKTKTEVDNSVPILQVQNPPPQPFNPPNLGLLNGVYDIACPGLSSPQGSASSRPILTLETPGIWGAYNFANFQGILYLVRRPLMVGDACHFYWRGKDVSTGLIQSSENCCGQLDFPGNGVIVGRISLLPGIFFTGTRRPGPGTPVRTAMDMRSEWDHYT